MDSKSFLVQILTTFAENGKAIKMKGYQILVHALKSTSLSIGAANLIAAAKNLELATKNGVA